MRAAVVRQDGDVIERRDAPFDRDRVVEQVAQVVSALRDTAPKIAAVGVAIPGLVNRQTEDERCVGRSLQGSTKP